MELEKWGDAVQVDIAGSFLITSNKPVSAVRFQSGFTLDGPVEPAMAIVVPVSQYLYQYRFQVSTTRKLFGHCIFKNLNTREAVLEIAVYHLTVLLGFLMNWIFSSS